MNRYLRAFGLGAVVVGSGGAGWAARGVVPSPPPAPIFAPRAAASPPPCLAAARELPLETEAAPSPRSPPPLAPRPEGARHVRMTDDEGIAAWVPASAKYRYTVIESSTIAENIGLLPLGTAAAHPEWTFDVVALIEAERAGHPVCPPGLCATPKDVPEEAFLAASRNRW